MTLLGVVGKGVFFWDNVSNVKYVWMILLKMKLLKSVNFWQSYLKKIKGGRFLGHSVDCELLYSTLIYYRSHLIGNMTSIYYQKLDVVVGITLNCFIIQIFAGFHCYSCVKRSSASQMSRTSLALLPTQSFIVNYAVLCNRQGTPCYVILSVL